MIRHAVSLTMCVLLLSGCGGGSGGESAPPPIGGGGGGGGAATGCTSLQERQFVLNEMRTKYLYNDLLPEGATASSRSTAQELLSFLVEPARVQRKRGARFSFLTTIAEDNAFIQSGAFAGFGFGSRPEGGGMRITFVVQGSPAEAAGFERGQVILSINGQPVTNSSELQQAAGPPDVGLQRTFRIRRLDGSEFEVTVAKAEVDTVPIPTHQVFAQPGTPGIAYIDFRAFIRTADTALNTLFQEFREAGITDYVIDLRYNGGGLVSTAELLGDLLGGLAAQGEVYYQIRFNPARSALNEEYRFEPLPQTVLPARIVFITSRGSASASELLLNGLEPHLEVAMVGDRTFGKPVGQEGFDSTACGLRLRPISFDIANADGRADYFGGLPVDGAPVLCRAADDLDFALGDPDEA
ncbi:MAG: PDZ domain-containing protein, partial [Gammaproteobacteria bacterium]|nr:PDZ domain-containing protein [Gammaproteobacteria bacterium]